MSPEEERLLKEKAVNYRTNTSMVWDAIKIFDDKATIGKFETLNEMIALYQKYQQDLSCQCHDVYVKRFEITKRVI
jgi:hypothetical protein